MEIFMIERSVIVSVIRTSTPKFSGFVSKKAVFVSGRTCMNI
jgi:hypothetical protein